MTSLNNDTVTAIDIIERQNRLEQEAKEALPGKFEQCTFNLGYVRQPLFACKTCEENKTTTTTISSSSSSSSSSSYLLPTCQKTTSSGMCYSCSIACHGDHELYELFPKRHFRCDCGVSDKFGKHPCALSTVSKSNTTNEENSYNHNFIGRYCRCDMEYDPNTEAETMYQCVVCEDWFHERCIGEIPEDMSDFESYVCRSCTKLYPFLYNIDNKFSIGISKGDQQVHKWINSQSMVVNQHGNSNSEITLNQNGSDNDTNQAKTATVLLSEPIDSKVSNSNSLKRQIDEINNEVKVDSTADNNNKQQKNFVDTCKNGNYLLNEQESIELFLKDGWREHLCRCKKCLNKYKENKIEFLLQEETTVEPEDDEDAGKSLLEVGTEQISRLDRTAVLDSINAYQLLSKQLKDYFKSFQESGKVVTENDIRIFFDDKIKKK